MESVRRPVQKLDLAEAKPHIGFSFQLAIIAHPQNVICCDIAPEAKITLINCTGFKYQAGDKYLWVDSYFNTLNNLI